MEEAAASFRQEFGAGFLAKRRKVGVGRICDHDIALLAHQQTHGSHASAPTYHDEPFFLQKQSSHIDVLALLLPQRDKTVLIPQPTAAEIEASERHSIRQ